MAKIKLNLGCGYEYLKGWKNIDNKKMFPDIKVDESADIFTLAYPDNSVDTIRLSHVAMYFRPEQMSVLLYRFYNWLTEGGKLEIETIDLYKIVKLLANETDPVKLNDWGLVNLFGTDKTGPHVWGWTQKTLNNALNEAGFKHRITFKGRKKPNRDFLIIATK